MSYGASHPTDAELITEELKTTKARRRMYGAVFIVLLAVICFILAQVLNILAAPVGILVWTTIIVFCLRGPVNYLEKKGLARIWGTCIAYVLMKALITS